MALRDVSSPSPQGDVWHNLEVQGSGRCTGVGAGRFVFLQKCPVEPGCIQSLVECVKETAWL